MIQMIFSTTLVLTVATANVEQAKYTVDDIRLRDPFVLPVQEREHTLVISDAQAGYSYLDSSKLALSSFHNSIHFLRQSRL